MSTIADIEPYAAVIADDYCQYWLEQGKNKYECSLVKDGMCNLAKICKLDRTKKWIVLWARFLNYKVSNRERELRRLIRKFFERKKVKI